MKQNSIGSLAGKMFFSLFLLTVGSFITLIFTQSSDSKIIWAIVQIGVIAFIMHTVYSQTREAGDKDCNLVKTGKINESYFKGLYIGLLASLPYLISGLLLVLSRMGLFAAGFINYYRAFINSFYMCFNITVLPSGLTVFEQNPLSIIGSLMTLLIVPLTAMFGYILGYRRVRISDKILYKKRKTE